MEKSEIQRIVNYLETNYSYGPNGNNNQMDDCCLSPIEKYLYFKGHTMRVRNKFRFKRRKKNIDPKIQSLIEKYNDRYKKDIDDYKRIIEPEWRKLRNQNISSDQIILLFGLLYFIMIILWLLEQVLN
jgi:hypothetical protein